MPCQNNSKTPQKRPMLRLNPTQRVWVLGTKISAFRGLKTLKSLSKVGCQKHPRRQKPMKTRIFIDSRVNPLKSLTKKTTQKVIHSRHKIHQKTATLAGDYTVSVAQTPDGHLKLLHLWPVKLLQAGRSDYDISGLMAMRAAASLRR